MVEPYVASLDVPQSRANPLKIAYAIQNVGGIHFNSDVGDTVPVKQSLLGLHRLGHHVRVFHLKKNRVLKRTPPDLVEGLPVTAGFPESTVFRTFERIGRRLGRDLHLRYYAFVDSYRFYTTSLKRLQHFDLCHEHNGLFGIGAAAACRRMGLPYMLTFSADLFLERELVGKPLKGLHRRVAERQTRFTYSQARAILCVSAAAKKHLVEHWEVSAQKIHIMPNGVDINLFKPLPAEADLPEAIRAEGRAPRIVFVGGFQPWHGLDILVESFARVHSAMPEARLLLVGDGRARTTVDRAITAHGLGDAVKITGFVPQDQIPRWLSAADIAVLPYPRLPKELWFSRLKLYEYMASGKAIVASRAGQIAEVIKDGYNGVLTPPGDVDALADALLDLLQDPERRRRLGLQARKQAEKQHSWDQYVRRLETIYRQLLKN
jgi:glycosyltransferase involved in cell wall biosynthesis